MLDTDLFYLTIPTNNADEAISLENYLNQHGVLAAREGVEMVVCTLTDPAAAATIADLKKTWSMFWDHYDSGLWGLPVYQKP
jgi:hypothetical protein